MQVTKARFGSVEPQPLGVHHDIRETGVELLQSWRNETRQVSGYEADLKPLQPMSGPRPAANKSMPRAYANMEQTGRRNDSTSVLQCAGYGAGLPRMRHARVLVRDKCAHACGLERMQGECMVAREPKKGLNV